MPYYTPTPSNGHQWSQSSVVPQHGQATHHHQNASLPPQSPVNGQQPNMQQMYAVMAMMSHMQPTFPNNAQQQQTQHPFPQSQPSRQSHTPVHEQTKMTTPGPSDNRLVAEIIYAQTQKGLSYKAALESMHGHNHIMAYAWKDYFLENKETIDNIVYQLRGQILTNGDSHVEVSAQSSSSAVGTNGLTESSNNGRNQSQTHLKLDSHPRTRLSKHEESASSRGKREESVPKKDRRDDNASRKGKPKDGNSIRVSKDKKEKKVKTNGNENGNGKSTRRSKQNEENISRRTMNSLSSAPSNDLLNKVPPAVTIDIHTGLPAAPSRSPSPPLAAPNSKYTEQDTIYFFRRVAYDLVRAPDLPKSKLCDVLGEKAPHHSAASWRTFWHKHDDVADKMYLLTQLDDEDREKAIQSWKTGASVTTSSGPGRSARSKNVSYRESSESSITDDDDSEQSSSSPSSEENSSDSSEEIEDDALESTDEDEELGKAGSPFTMAENRALAKHIASNPDWLNGHREWESFFQAHPQRSPEAWKESYRRKSREIDALAKKYIAKSKKSRGSVSAQRGRPSWARNNGGSSQRSSSIADNHGQNKRKFARDGSRDQSEEKRTKLKD